MRVNILKLLYQLSWKKLLRKSITNIVNTSISFRKIAIYCLFICITYRPGLSFLHLVHVYFSVQMLQPLSIILEVEHWTSLAPVHSIMNGCCSFVILYISALNTITICCWPVQLVLLTLKYSYIYFIYVLSCKLLLVSTEDMGWKSLGNPNDEYFSTNFHIFL